jgi:hypothetical protein
MQPTPFTTAFPKLAAQIDDERPLISAALLDILVTDIQDDFILAEVTTEHSYDILISPAQHNYLNRALSKHWDKEASVSLTRHIPSDPPSTESTPSIPSTPAPKRIANTLTFTERTALQNWMVQPDNTTFTALESDPDTARQATKDLGFDITPGNIASMRKILGIEKVKPTKPEPTPTHPDIDLVALHAQVQQHHLQLDPIAGVNIAEVLVNLRDSLHKLETTVLQLRGPLEEHDQRLKSLEASSD